MAARPFVLRAVAEATGYPAGMIRQELQFAKGVLDHLGLDEEDVLQDFALSVCQKPSRGPDSSEVNGRTRVCIRRGLIDAVRQHTGRSGCKRYLLATSPLDAMTDDLQPLAKPPSETTISRTLLAAVQALPARQRAIVERTVIGDETFVDVHAQLGFPVASTYYAHRSRALRALKKAVDRA